MAETTYFTGVLGFGSTLSLVSPSCEALEAAGFPGGTLNQHSTDALTESNNLDPLVPSFNMVPQTGFGWQWFLTDGTRKDLKMFRFNSLFLTAHLRLTSGSWVVCADTAASKTVWSSHIGSCQT